MRAFLRCARLAWPLGRYPRQRHTPASHMDNRAHSRSSAGSFSAVTLIHYAVVAILVVGAAYYVYTKPPTLNPMVDKRAAEALALVQTHRALGFPTILQAMNEHVRSMKERGQGVRLGEWR